jgi:6-phosphogluconolactonase (cycloisomerase 2 family)
MDKTAKQQNIHTTMDDPSVTATTTAMATAAAIVFVGCYTKPRQADPFEEELGGVPHDDSKVGTGILALTLSSEGKLAYLNHGNPVVPASIVPNPSYLALLPLVEECLSSSSSEQEEQQQGGVTVEKLSRNGRHYLCAVSEVEDGKLFVFSMGEQQKSDHQDSDGSDNDTIVTNLQPVGEALSTYGSYPCHIMTKDMAGDGPNRLFVSNYGSPEEGGAVSMYLLGGFTANSTSITGSNRSGSTSSTTTAGTDHGTSNAHKTNNNNNAPPPPLVVTHKDTVVLGRTGSNISPAGRQSSTHAHCCAGCHIHHNSIPGSTTTTTTTATGILYTTDLGADAIIQYDFRSFGKIIEVGRLATPPGSGPRSIVFNPQPHLATIAIVSLEMTAQVQLVHYRRHDHCLEASGSPVSLLPLHWPQKNNEEDVDAASEEGGDADRLRMTQFNNGRWASDAVWSTNGLFVFAAARLHNSISVFRLLYQEYTTAPDDVRDLSLEFVQRCLTGGQTPRCLAVSPCGNFLLVAHQHSHDVSCFAIHPTLGRLQFMDKIEAPCAACVKMISTTAAAAVFPYE